MFKNLVSICSLGGKKTVKQTKNPETVIRRCSVKEKFLKMSQNSHLQWSLFLTELQVLSDFKNTYFVRHLRTVAFENHDHSDSHCRFITDSDTIC